MMSRPTPSSWTQKLLLRPVQGLQIIYMPARINYCLMVCSYLFRTELLCRRSIMCTTFFRTIIIMCTININIIDDLCGSRSKPLVPCDFEAILAPTAGFAGYPRVRLGESQIRWLVYTSSSSTRVFLDRLGLVSSLAPAGRGAVVVIVAVVSAMLIAGDLGRDGNGYEISTYPRIANPIGADTGLSLCPRARAWVQL